VFTALRPRTTRALRAWLPLFLTGAFLLAGHAHATSPTRFLTLTGGDAADVFGWSVAGVGDVNGDGYGDLIVGAPGIGRAYLHYGGPEAAPVADVVFHGPGGGPLGFGYSVSSAGDFNGDGYPDIIVGAAFS
jgi:VCBS repeat protein